MRNHPVVRLFIPLHRQIVNYSSGSPCSMANCSKPDDIVMSLLHPLCVSTQSRIIMDALTPTQATAVATMVLTLKVYATICIQGYMGVLGGSRPPEDVSLFPDAGAQSFDGSAKWGSKQDDAKAKAALQNDKRWRRIVLNDVENIPLGVAVAWGSLQVAHSPRAHVGLVLLFAASRVLHTVFYAYGVQPWRGIVWTSGVMSVIGLSINGAVGALLAKSKGA